MITHPDYPENRAKLKRCNMFYSIFSKIYIVMILFMVLAFVPNLFTSLSNGGDLLSFILLACILIPCNIAMGIYSMYTKKTKFAFFSIIPAGFGVCTFAASVPFCFGVIDIMLLGLSIVLSVLLPKVNKTYDHLSQQEGFPYFNELQTQVLENADNAMRTDPYQRREEFYVKEEVRGVMDDFVLSDQQLEVKADNKNDYMESI